MGVGLYVAGSVFSFVLVSSKFQAFVLLQLFTVAVVISSLCPINKLVLAS